MRTLLGTMVAILCAGVCLAAEPYFTRGPRTPAETFFAQCVDTSLPALKEIPARMAAGDVADAEGDVVVVLLGRGEESRVHDRRRDAEPAQRTRRVRGARRFARRCTRVRTHIQNLLRALCVTSVPLLPAESPGGRCLTLSAKSRRATSLRTVPKRNPT